MPVEKSLKRDIPEVFQGYPTYPSEKEVGFTSRKKGPEDCGLRRVQGIPVGDHLSTTGPKTAPLPSVRAREQTPIVPKRKLESYVFPLGTKPCASERVLAKCWRVVNARSIGPPLEHDESAFSAELLLPFNTPINSDIGTENRRRPIVR